MNSSPKRKRRTVEERNEVLDRDPTLNVLQDAIAKIDNITIEPDGQGACYFNVYLRGRTGRYESFLRLFSPFTDSYVCWKYQHGTARDLCNRIWAPYVKNEANDDGSNLGTGVDADTVVRCIERYARHCGPMFPLKAKDLEPPPPDRVETTTYRVLRDTTLAQHIKAIHQHECQICGLTIDLPNGSRYAEAHHIRPLGSPHDGSDVAGNILVLCPNHHAMCDYGVIALDVTKMRSRPEHELDSRFIDYHNSIVHSPPPKYHIDARETSASSVLNSESTARSP